MFHSIKNENRKFSLSLINSTFRTKMCNRIDYIIDYQVSRAIPNFRHRFAGKCDRQSRDLTQFTSGYISRLNRLLITPDHHVRTHT
jgi:hypothetical protein